MTENNIITIIIAVAFASTLSVPVVKILKNSFKKLKGIEIKSKNGEIVKLDFNKKNDVNTVIKFTDVFLGLK